MLDKMIALVEESSAVTFVALVLALLVVYGGLSVALALWVSPLVGTTMLQAAPIFFALLGMWRGLCARDC
jgi:hypothetical protein